MNGKNKQRKPPVQKQGGVQLKYNNAHTLKYEPRRGTLAGELMVEKKE